MQNVAQIFLLFMPMNQESIWLISIPSSVITVFQIHTPPTPLPPKKKRHFQKAVGGVNKFFFGHSKTLLIPFKLGIFNAS